MSVLGKHEYKSYQSVSYTTCFEDNAAHSSKPSTDATSHLHRVEPAAFEEFAFVEEMAALGNKSHKLMGLNKNSVVSHASAVNQFSDTSMAPILTKTCSMGLTQHDLETKQIVTSCTLVKDEAEIRCTQSSATDGKFLGSAFLFQLVLLTQNLQSCN